MGSQVPLQLCQCGEVQPTLDTYVFLAFFMLQLMCTKLARVSEASTAYAAAGGEVKVYVCERQRRIRRA